MTSDRMDPQDCGARLRLRGALAVALVAFPAAAWSASPEPGTPPRSRMVASESPLSAAAQRDMVALPAAVYPLGHERGAPDARPAHRVGLGGFAIDRTEVTNAQFAEFLRALDLEVRGDFRFGEATRADFSEDTWPRLLEEGRRPDLYPIIGLDDRQVRIEARGRALVAARGYEDHPVAEVTWRGARSYCAWRGARLPTEAEWEAAARGTQGRVYPWGDEPPGPDRVYAGYPSGVTAPVGSRPAGATPDGILDLSGSLAEWTASLYRPYPYDPDDGREDPTASGERVTRGGDYVFDTAPDRLTAYFRGGFSRAPQDGHRHIGLRCAADRR